MSAATADRGKELADPPSSDGIFVGQSVLDPVNSWSKKVGLYDAEDASGNKWELSHLRPGLGEPVGFSTAAARSGQDKSSMHVQEPDSPTSPSSRPPPVIYFSSPLSKCRTPPTMPTDRELYYEDLMVRFTSLAMKRFESVEEAVPDFECQSMEFAESALEHHNNDANNIVKYELIKAIESTCIFEIDGAYGHVNFSARSKQEDSEEKLFFAELHLQGDITSLTCFCCLNEKKDQIGGLMDMDREDKGVDLKHCYACGDAVKHPSDGASYLAGHCTAPQRYECP